MLKQGKAIFRWAAYIMLVLTTFFWGATFVVVKDAVSKVDVFVFLSHRFTLSFVIMAAFGALFKRKIDTYTLKKGVKLGLLLFGGFALQTFALLYTSASNTAFLTGLNVVFVPLLSAMLFRERVSKNMIIAVILAFAGLYLLCAGASWSLNKGDLLGISCAVCIGLHIIYTGKYAWECDIYWLATIQIGTIGLLSTVIAVVTGKPVFTWHEEIKTALIICILFATIFAFLVQTTMQKYINPVNTALIFCLEPVFAAVCAYFLIGERLGTRGAIGAGLILIGMLSAEVSLKPFLKKKSNDV